MKKSFYIFLLIFSLLSINGREYRCEIENYSFNIIEKYFMEECDFIQNGLKVEYTTRESRVNEYQRILEALFKDNLYVKEEKNSISAYSENINYSVKFVQDNEILKVEIVILNTDKTVNKINLEKLVKNIKSSETIDERYFSFIKGKISNDSNDIFNKIEENLYEDSIKVAEINNGYSIKATMKDNEMINIGKVNYDTGSYLIIGTPIIFITY
ncbi:hypothetical protein [Clostridium celatum]|uniref:TATA-box binding protein n=1 Tax=Clostridium celatum DSM 1785 TaxID=545697 RepID=L1QI64_9CLOT|nr:hypothetical protein [Clostridium celatum]EKY27668.1 hypothetical protein HMPREF0216_01311 [Clostridium celatum DSM 1785]MCE9655631.1 hypothetical protein [Clostridium celatum]MDU2265191.1 hypothetical protein [Clostridium celatum]MDU3724046.1 hypothetical protein [Clostridium celatum]MDU6297378.1 hypothetical protein [Clostridium celatum]